MAASLDAFDLQSDLYIYGAHVFARAKTGRKNRIVTMIIIDSFVAKKMLCYVVYYVLTDIFYYQYTLPVLYLLHWMTA